MYTVKVYKGDYLDRQLSANKDKAVAYVEHHFNSAGPTASYALVIVGSNASQTSVNWGSWYAKAVAEQFNTKVYRDDGVSRGGLDGRGDGNLKHTAMPAVLLEPLFVSNPQQAGIVRSVGGQQALARILVESIRRFFPQGGLIAFSVGHKYKKSRPKDRGAELAGGGNEADFAEMVLKQAAEMLVGEHAAPQPRKLRVMKGDTVLLETQVDEDAVLVWSSDRNLLFIPD